MPRVYLDTSAYLAVLLGEKGTAALERQMRGAELCSSTLMVLEAERNLVRFVREGILGSTAYENAIFQLRSDLGIFILRDVTLDLALNLEFPPTRTPRTSDLIHLRTARWFLVNGGLKAFLTTDQSQQKAAREFGLPSG